MVEKMSVSLPPETLLQLEWLAKNVFLCPRGLSRSTLIKLAISYAYEKAPRG